MKKAKTLLPYVVFILLSSLSLTINVTAQTVTVEYLNPGFSNTTYDFIRFGDSGSSWGGLMLNKIDSDYGNGNDFTIFSYAGRDIVLFPWDGNVIFYPYSNPNYGNVGIGTANPEQKLDVSGNIALGVNKSILFRRSDGNWSGRITNIDRELRFRNTSGNGTITFYQNPDGSTQEIMRIHTNGYVGIGTTSPTEKLTVNGTIKAEEVIVVENVGADFVFDKDYKLPGLNQVEAYIKQHNHLPEIPSAEEMKKNGVKMGALQMKLLQKIEELTLYMIGLKKKSEAQTAQIKNLKRRLHNLNKN